MNVMFDRRVGVAMVFVMLILAGGVFLFNPPRDGEPIAAVISSSPTVVVEKFVDVVPPVEPEGGEELSREDEVVDFPRLKRVPPTDSPSRVRVKDSVVHVVPIKSERTRPSTQNPSTTPVVGGGDDAAKEPSEGDSPVGGDKGEDVPVKKPSEGDSPVSGKPVSLGQKVGDVVEDTVAGVAGQQVGQVVGGLVGAVVKVAEPVLGLLSPA